MAETPLNGRTVIVAEDALAIAQELETALRDAGCAVVGPFPSLARLTAAIDAPGFRADAAVLDVDLRGEDVFPAADRLAAKGVPIVLTTGFDAGHIPDAYRGLTRLEKPVRLDEVLAALRRAIEGS